MNNSQVAEAFANGATSGKSGNMFIDGDTIYSYGYHFPIATRVKEGLYLINKNGYSQTTARHINQVRSAITGDIVECPQVDGKLTIDRDYLEASKAECIAKMGRCRSQLAFQYLYDEANRYAEMIRLAR